MVDIFSGINGTNITCYAVYVSKVQNYTEMKEIPLKNIYIVD